MQRQDTLLARLGFELSPIIVALLPSSWHSLRCNWNRA
jgi:hypothetical protein